MVIPTGEGGGQDTATRQLAPYFEDEIGANLSFDYRAGASHRIGSRSIIERADSYEIMSTNATTQMANMLDDDPQYDVQTDFAMIGNQIGESGCFMAQDGDDRFTDVAEFIDYAADNPGELNVSTSNPTGRNVLTLELMKLNENVDFNIVPYEGGSEARTALLQGEVDATHTNIFTGLGIADGSQYLCVHATENRWEGITGTGVPTYNDVMSNEIPNGAAEVRRFWCMSQDAADEYPDRYDMIVDAFANAIQNQSYLDDLAEGDVDESGMVMYLDPEETRQANEEMLSVYQEYPDLVA
jgi:tripartite-type tricarboxylate transporter receptor subunit TctC